jgi:hypothetical protein
MLEVRNQFGTSKLQCSNMHFNSELNFDTKMHIIQQLHGNLLSRQGSITLKILAIF